MVLHVSDVRRIAERVFKRLTGIPQGRLSAYNKRGKTGTESLSYPRSIR
jgi:hypothetical protein